MTECSEHSSCFRNSAVLYNLTSHTASSTNHAAKRNRTMYNPSTAKELANNKVYNKLFTTEKMAVIKLSDDVADVRSV